MSDKIKHSHGRHPNSLLALEQGRERGRIKSIETRNKNKEIKQLEKERQRAEKDKYILDLELEIFRIRHKRDEDNKLRQLMEHEKYKPLSRTNINLIIKKVFNK